MNRFLKTAAVLAACGVMIGAVAGCGDNGGEPLPGEPGVFGSQITAAQTTYNNFYGASERKGGLMKTQNAVAATAHKALRSTDATNGAVTLADIRDIIAAHKLRPVDNTAVVATYVSDIFTYSQVQLSLLTNCGDDALVGAYKLDYSDVDFDGADLGGISSSWFQSVLLKTASFTGVDENGKVYCAQTHMNVKAIVEYYYNSDSDMGVTTLNWHYNGDTLSHFEYHFCDVSTGTIIYINAGNQNAENGQISIMTANGSLPSNALTSAESQTICAFAGAEALRIAARSAEVAADNAALAAEKGIKTPAETPTVKVTFDFSVLRTMLDK